MASDYLISDFSRLSTVSRSTPCKTDPITGERALLDLMDKTGYNMVQQNGQRKYGGPPPGWEGPVPPRGCEIFIGRIPRDCYEDELVPIFETMGKIYELRLMMDFSGANRGYAFVMYTCKADAQRAVREMNNYEIRKGRFLGVCQSVDNCRLFVGGIPKTKARDEIYEEMTKGRRPTTVGDVLMATGRGLLNLPYIVNTALIFILFDTSYYRSKTPLKDYNVFDQFVVTPLNFLSYNRRSENLAQHGVHPRYLHALVNTPMLFGPLIAFVLLFPYMVSFVKRKDEKNMLVMLFFSMVVPLGLLSIFPHQEARFIIPLLIPSIILSSYGLELINSRALYAIFIVVWIPHNLFMGVMMGAFHQGGVVPSLLYLQAQKADGAFNGGATIVYHRTYMPPKSLLQLYKHESRFVKLIDLQTKVDDLELAEELMQYDTFYLVTPYSVNRLGLLLEDKFTIEMDASFYPHLSMEDPPELDEIVRLCTWTVKGQ